MTANLHAPAHASEDGHWYDSETNQQIDQVPGYRGKMVRPDIRHAQKFQLAPGLTTIIRCAHREGIVRYREHQTLLASLTLPRNPGETESDWLGRIRQDAKAAANAAAEAGTLLHAKIAARLAGSPQTDPTIAAAISEIDRLTGTTAAPWQTEVPCVSPHGFGTKLDLFLPASVFTPTAWVLDIKTKDGNLEKEELWDEHHQQLAAGRHAAMPRLAGPQTRCAILFVSRTEPKARAIEASVADLDAGLMQFDALLSYWFAKNRYRPEWAYDEPIFSTRWTS